jgi:hypothetical protein
MKTASGAAKPATPKPAAPAPTHSKPVVDAGGAEPPH